MTALRLLTLSVWMLAAGSSIQTERWGWATFDLACAAINARIILKTGEAA